MGLNPYRPQKHRRSDLVFVAAGLIVAVLLVLPDGSTKVYAQYFRDGTSREK